MIVDNRNQNRQDDENKRAASWQEAMEDWHRARITHLLERVGVELKRIANVLEGGRTP